MKLRAEFARSSRSRCRACGRMIEGGTIRWAKENEKDDIRPQYTHLSCLNLAKSTRKDLKEDDIVFDGDFTKKQRDAIVEAFHLTGGEKPEERRMKALKRHEVAPEKRNQRPDYMVDEEEEEQKSEDEEEEKGQGGENEEDEEYVEDEEGQDNEDEDEEMADDEAAADLDELKAEASDFQKPNKRRRKNEETELMEEESAEKGKQETGARGGPKKSESATKAEEMESKKQGEPQENENEEDNAKGKKTHDKESESREEKRKSIMQKYQNMGSDELREYLRANKQIMSGQQEDLRKRCIDCAMYGALPTCPQCQKGRLIKNEGTGRVECHGYYDEDAGMPARCGFDEPEEKIQRRSWREPSDAPPILFNVHIKGEEGPASLTAEVKRILDTLVGSKNLSKRDSAKALMKYARESDLDLPEDDDEAIDTVESHLDDYTQNGNIDYEAAFAEMAREYSKDPDIKGMRKSKSKFEKNEKIADMLNELAVLYGKLGGQDRFRARAEKKAAGAVRSLDFEVTSGKELSTGDTKVEGIGHDTGEMIDEFLETGKIEKLEDARKRVKEQSG